MGGAEVGQRASVCSGRADANPSGRLTTTWYTAAALAVPGGAKPSGPEGGGRCCCCLGARAPWPGCIPGSHGRHCLARFPFGHGLPVVLQHLLHLPCCPPALRHCHSHSRTHQCSWSCWNGLAVASTAAARQSARLLQLAASKDDSAIQSSSHLPQIPCSSISSSAPTRPLSHLSWGACRLRRMLQHPAACSHCSRCARRQRRQRENPPTSMD